MFRAISEIAAAITVWSPFENPAAAASSRPCWRACTTSTSAAILRRSSSGTLRPSRESRLVFQAARRATSTLLIQERETFLQVQGRGHAFQCQPELNHGERDLGLNPD